ncbi:MAG: MscL family protein [Patescibacteria group bacterium]|jgi:large conductance mechanosensitive channel
MMTEEKKPEAISEIKEAPENFLKGLLSFLKEYSVLGLAIGLIIGQASKDLVDAIVNGLFMPFISLFISKDNLENLSFTIREVDFELGKVISSLLVFLIIMALLYFIIKKIVKNDSFLEKKG